MGGAIAGYALLTFELDQWLTDIHLAVSLGVTFDKGFYAVCFLTLCEVLPGGVLMCCGTKMPTVEQEMAEAGKLKGKDDKGKGKGKFDDDMMMKGKGKDDFGDPFGKGKDDFGKGKGDPFGDPFKGGPPPGGWGEQCAKWHCGVAGFQMHPTASQLPWIVNSMHFFRQALPPAGGGSHLQNPDSQVCASRNS